MTSQRQLFLNSSGRLRSGWRLLVFLLVYVALLFLFGAFVRVVYAVTASLTPGLMPGPFVQQVAFRILLMSSAIVAGYLCARLLEGLPWRSLGLWFHHRWMRDFLIGSLVGIASLTLATAIATAGGGLTFTISARGLFIEIIKSLVLSALVFFIGALAEEALARGYPLQTMTRAGLFGLGAVLTSVGFAALHFNNPNFKFGLIVFNLVLGGFWFAIAYWRTRSLWFPLGIHWAWNWALGSLFGLPVSGITEIAPYPLLRGFDLGPAWLTGGEFGIEGGIACTAALIISSLFVWRTRFVSASTEMLRLTSEENPRPISIASDKIRSGSEPGSPRE